MEKVRWIGLQKLKGDKMKIRGVSFRTLYSAKNEGIPFLGHKLILKREEGDMVELVCHDKCPKKNKIRLRCSIFDLENLEALLWPEIIKGEYRK
jgi:hypothetical protein